MQTSDFREFVRLVVAGDVGKVTRRLRSSPALATMSLPVRAAEPRAAETFFAEIRRYLYGGDTALHLAAAAFSCPIAKLLVSHGADCRAKNRRGAVPLHYASDGNWPDPHRQAEVIKYLVSIGGDPNALDKSGVAPLHRAVRTRSHAAVRALLDAGANPRQPNKSGSSPLHLAVQTTGATGSGSNEARRQQEMIIRLLVQRGAELTDKDSRGKMIKEAATSSRIRDFLAAMETD